MVITVKEKGNRKFSIRMQKKLVVLFMGILLAFAGLGGRLVWIAREKGIQYQKQVLSQQRYDSTTIPFRRGDIVDARGTQLATSEKVYNVIIDASVMTASKGKYLEPTLQALGQCFPQLDMTAIRQYVSTNTTSRWYVALRRLTYEEISDFQALAAQDGSLVKGVWFEEEYKRLYPGGSLAADVIGFANSSNMGQYGLEEYYNDILNGTNGREYGYLNDDSALERTVKPAVDGYTLHSTIDAHIQGIVEKYLREFNESRKDQYRTGNGAENVGCIIMEVDTGNILAMASFPTYDLNDTRNPEALLGSNLYEKVDTTGGYFQINKTDTVITPEVLGELTKEENEEQFYVNLNNLWKNYCITGTYEPGSTVKPFTVAAALENGSIDGSEHYTCSGRFEVGGHKIGCHPASGGHGDVSVQSSVAWSCNIALIKIGQALGADVFSKFQNIFNFGLKTNVDMTGEARTENLVYTAEEMGVTDLATNSFGQNFNVTMIQMITGYCSLINGGSYYEPHAVSKITNASGATVQNIEPRVLKQTVSESTSALIRQYCRATVMEEGGEHRTGQTARPAGYAIGGKTGTAEAGYPRDHEEYVVSFIGHAPADDPKIAIYVVVDRVNAEKQDDAKYATGIVRNILTEVLPYLNIFMTEELSEAEVQELNERQLAITNSYTQNPEDVPPEGGEGTEPPQDNAYSNGDGTMTDPTGETGSVQPGWLNFPVDPATGHRVNPETGQHLDPQTGELIGENEGVLDSSIPANPNLFLPPQE